MNFRFTKKKIIANMLISGVLTFLFVVFMKSKFTACLLYIRNCKYTSLLSRCNDCVSLPVFWLEILVPYMIFFIIVSVSSASEKRAES